MKKIYTGLLAIIFISTVTPAALRGQEIPRERLFLITDKNSYVAGEHIWLSAYTTDKQGKPLAISSIGYIELLDGNSLLTQVKIPIRQGNGSGWIKLPENLPSGNYMLSAYTRYMLNEGESVFFTKIVPVVNPFGITDNVALSDLPYPVDTSTDEPGNIVVRTNSDVLPVRRNSTLTIEGLPQNTRQITISIAGDEIIPVPTDEANIIQWSSTIADEPPAEFNGEYIPEYSGFILSGTMFDTRNNTPSDDFNVNPYVSVVGENIMVFGGMSTGSGEINFNTTLIIGRKEIASVVIDDPERKYRVDIQTDMPLRRSAEIPELILSEFIGDKLLQRGLGVQTMNYYRGEEINNFLNHVELNWKPDKVYTLADYTRFGSFREIVIEYIPELRFRRDNNSQRLEVLARNTIDIRNSGSLILLDGIPIDDHQIIYNYNPDLVRRVEIYTDKFIVGGRMFDGVAHFITYNADYPSLTTDSSIQVFDFEGLQEERKFWAPDYRVDFTEDRHKPDFRHTLLWVPSVEIKGREALEIPFVTSDLTGRFTVTVQGITETGNMVFGRTTFEVIE